MIGPEDIEKLSKLARIEVNPDERASFGKEIDSILVYVGQIQTAPSGEQAGGTLVVHNIVRVDEKPHESGIFTAAIIKGAPDKEGNYVKVKKIL